jgi:hypothetical protein
VRGREIEFWVAAVRLAAVPFAFLEVAVERGNYPPGHELAAWLLAAVFSGGALVLFRRRELRVAGLLFDLGVTSAFVVLYGFELGTPVRQLLFLPVLEGALQLGVRGGVLAAVVAVPALVVFEWRQAIRLDFYPFDVGHVLGPFGIALLLGLAVGRLSDRLDERRLIQ